jgi:hypothetical protein
MRRKNIPFQFEMPINSIQKVGKTYVSNSAHIISIVCSGREFQASEETLFDTEIVIHSVMFKETDILPVLKHPGCAEFFKWMTIEAEKCFSQIINQK